MEDYFSDRSIRNIIKQHAGNIPISNECVKIIKEYLNTEANRIIEAGVKEFRDQNQYRKQKRHRLHASVFREVLT